VKRLFTIVIIFALILSLAADIRVLAFDLSQTTNLTDAEKSALVYGCLLQKHGIWATIPKPP